MRGFYFDDGIWPDFSVIKDTADKIKLTMSAVADTAIKLQEIAKAVPDEALSGSNPAISRKSG